MRAHAAAIIVALAGGLAPAMARGVTNPSYETGPTMSTGWMRIPLGSDAVLGWTVDRGNIDYVGTMWRAAEATHSIDMNGNDNGRIYQVLETTPGTTYIVSFALSGNWGGIATKTLRVTAGNSTQLYSTYTKNNTSQNMHWSDQTFSFVATKATTTLRFASQNNGYFGTAIDNITLTAVPAPATAGLLGLALLRRRRR